MQRSHSFMGAGLTLADCGSGDTMMRETGPEANSDSWKRFMGRHWRAFALFVVAAALAFVGMILVLLWFVGQAQIDGLVPSTLDLWTMGNLVTFILNLLFWELLLIGIPVAVAAVAAWLWWRRLPLDERREYRFFRNRSRRSDGSGAFSLLVSLAFLLKVYLDGRWNVPFATWTFDYLVYTWITALVWVLLIFAIPAAVVLIWWVARGRRRQG
ncbi:MAG: hypothetical protein SA339_04210 [Methanomassiliicoccus sp.]|nr:hypothetical protein [Methanomassiliicoccus sp.]